MTDESSAGRRAIHAGGSTNVQDSLRAGFVRIALAVFSAVALPIFFPSAREYVGVSLAYLLGTILFQVAIDKNIGGSFRILLGGAMDIGFLTFVVYRMGTVSTPFVAAYSLVGMFNALVVPAWAAITLGGFGVVAYGVVSYLEALHYLPYAPDFPEYAAFVPTVQGASRMIALLAILVGVSTWVSHRIARSLRRREIELLHANALLEELSQRDPLTQLYNRRYFVRRVDEELARVRRGKPMAVLMMDLDGFKQVNDAFGHLMGDELLKKIAHAVRESVREVDVVARFGGDEFIVMLPDTDAPQARAVAERLVATVRAVGVTIAPSRPVTASVGIAFAHGEHDVTALLNVADDGAYRAKQAGGNRYYAIPELPVSQPMESGPRAVKAG